ncbi:hypothetical protein EV1_011970 [Malus domestica]
MFDVFKNKFTAAANFNSTKRSRNGGRMRRRRQYQMNPEDDQLVQQPASHESPVSIDPPLSPRQREAEFHYHIPEVKDGGVWLHLQLDDMDYLRRWTLRARRDAMRQLTYPTTHNRLPPRLPYDPLHDFGVDLFVVRRVLEYNYQTTENIAVNICVMDASPSTNNQEGVQTEEDHQTTVHENNNVDVPVAPVEEDHQTTVNEKNNVGMAVIMEDHQAMMINANNNVRDNVNVANEMIFPSLDDHTAFKLSSLHHCVEVIFLDPLMSLAIQVTTSGTLVWIIWILTSSLLVVQMKFLCMELRNEETRDLMQVDKCIFLNYSSFVNEMYE